MSSLRDRVLTRFPALVEAAAGLAIAKANGVYTFMLDFLSAAAVDSVADLTTRYVILVSENGDDELLERIALDDLVATAQGNVQVITAGGTQDIDEAAAVVIVNQTAGAVITLNLPEAATKIGPVKVVDWKGDAATNTITIARHGSEKFNGLAQNWVIGADNASAVFTPYPGEGYAV